MRVPVVDENYQLSKLVRRTDPNWRAGVSGPYDVPWKMISSTDGRQAWLWTRMEHDTRLSGHAKAVWNRWGKAPPVADDVIARTLAMSAEAVSTIRARGGEVVFLRPPSAPELRVIEHARIARQNGWNPLLASADAQGVHSDDVQTMQGLVFPENSHHLRTCAMVYTDVYVRRLATLTDAPAPLSADDCHVAPSLPTSN